MESLVSYGSEDEQDLEPIPQNTNTMGRTRDHRERDVRPTLGHHRDRRDRDRDTRDRDRDTTRELQEDNYDNVGMDMSDEESNNNSSPHRNDDRRNKNRAGYSRESYEDSSTSRIRERSRSSELSRERDNSRYNSSNKSREETNNRYSRKPYDDYKQRRSSRTPPPPPSSSSTTKNYDFKSSRYDSQKSNKNNYDRKDLSSSYHGSRNSRGDERKPDRDRRRPSSPVRDGERSRRSNSKDRRRSSSKDYSRKRSRTPPLPRYKRRSNSRDRDRDRDRGDDLGYERSKSYDRREKSKSLSNRSKSRERSKSKDINRDRRDRDRDRSRSRDRRDRRDDRSRSRDRDRDRRGDRDNRSSRSPYKGYKGRYDRTSNKLAVLEKLGIEIKTPDSQFITPQMLMQKSMTDKIEEVKNATGIELPKYYNPAVMNPSRYAEQIQKRRLLWGNKNKSSSTTSSSIGAGSNTTAPSGSDHQTEQIITAPTSHLITTSITNNEAPSGSGNGTGTTATIPKVWQQTKFVHDNDGKVASKFKRLMGIKDDVVAPSKELTNAETLKKQEEMFHSMEAQYEVARAATHTMRGVGLGFGAFGAGNFTR